MDRRSGQDKGAIFVAEVSSNHNRDLQRCMTFIDTAAGIGCGAVKFQLFKIDQLFVPEVLADSETHQKRKEWELPVEFLPELAARCGEKDIQLSCTPFYLNAVDELFPYVDFYKIASYELLWDELLVTCAQTGKPVVLSTGMATMNEIRGAVEALQRSGCEDLSLLHCVSGYPTPPEECGLATIQTLRDTFGCPVGWSDHSASAAVVLRAVNRWGANMIEFHLDLDGSGEEFSSGHCWLPEQMGEVIATAKKGIGADGDGKKTVQPCEMSDRDWRADPFDGLRPLKTIREKGSR